MDSLEDRKVYAYWTAEDRQLLIKLVHECTRNRKIDWDSVGEQFPDRTRQQCKSFYQNVLKKELGVVQKQHHRWTMDDKTILWYTAMTYSKDFATIQKLYFP